MIGFIKILLFFSFCLGVEIVYSLGKFYFNKKNISKKNHFMKYNRSKTNYRNTSKASAAVIFSFGG